MLITLKDIPFILSKKLPISYFLTSKFKYSQKATNVLTSLSIFKKVEDVFKLCGLSHNVLAITKAEFSWVNQIPCRIKITLKKSDEIMNSTGILFFWQLVLKIIQLAFLKLKNTKRGNKKKIKKRIWVNSLGNWISKTAAAPVDILHILPQWGQKYC